MELTSIYKINSISHITGGGLLENLPRSIPNDLFVEINTSSWEMPEIFKWLQKFGKISDIDMYRIFNCGIGMTIFVEEKDCKNIISHISHSGFKSYMIGVVSKKSKQNSVIFN